jgi:hypothetical protein
LGVLESLHIEAPVGRSGARFEAVLPTFALQGIDPGRLRYFVIEDDEGNRYPAMIDQLVALLEDPELTRIAGVVVAGGSA